MENNNELGIVRELAKQIISVIEKTERNNSTNWATPIENLGLSQRAVNCLQRNRINYVEQLIWLSRKDLFRLRGMGHISFNEINEKVKALGLAGWD